MCNRVWIIGVTWGYEDVGKDNQWWQEETGWLRQPSPEETEYGQSKQFGRKVNCSKDDLYQVNTHLEQPTVNRQRGQYVAVNREDENYISLCPTISLLHINLLNTLRWSPVQRVVSTGQDPWPSSSKSINNCEVQCRAYSWKSVTNADIFFFSVWHCCNPWLEQRWSPCPEVMQLLCVTSSLYSYKLSMYKGPYPK